MSSMLFFFFVMDYDVFCAATFTHKDDSARDSTRQAVRRCDGETPECAPVIGRRDGWQDRILPKHGHAPSPLAVQSAIGEYCTVMVRLSGTGQRVNLGEWSRAPGEDHSSQHDMELVNNCCEDTIIERRFV